MGMPRRFSSPKRRGSVPVNARPSADLPWSMCPAVPTTTYFMTLRGGHQEARHRRRAMAPTSRPSRLFSLLEPFLEKLFQFLVHGVNVTGAVLALLHLQPLEVLPRFSGLVLFDHFLYQLRRGYHHSFFHHDHLSGLRFFGRPYIEHGTVVGLLGNRAQGLFEVWPDGQVAQRHRSSHERHIGLRDYKAAHELVLVAVAHEDTPRVLNVHAFQLFEQRIAHRRALARQALDDRVPAGLPRRIMRR